MRTVTALLVLLASATAASGQQSADTTVTTQGFLQRDDQVDLWTIVVPLPLQVLGVRTYVLPVLGKPDRWSRFVNKYIQATGRITRVPERGTPPVGIEIDDAKEIDPPGTRHISVNHGTSLRADVMLSVIPNRFAWRSPDGQDTGVNPIVLYTILNRHSTPIFFFLPNNDFLCIATRFAGDNVKLWDSTTQVVNPDARRFSLQRAGILRDQIHLPTDAAPRRGRYEVRVGVCYVDDYDITTEFEIQ